MAAKKGRTPQKPGDPLLRALDDIREKKGLSRAEFSKACGIQSEALSRTMSGMHSPTLVTLSKMCGVLGVKLQIVEGEPCVEVPAACDAPQA
jgi:transcriptional regulator with XRE-family HTH domain